MDRNDGKIISIFANVVKMNEISNQVVINTQEEIEIAVSTLRELAMEE